MRSTPAGSRARSRCAACASAIRRAPQPASAGRRLGPADSRLLVTADAAFVKPPEAIRGIDLEIAAGETVALVGETGAGKSTVMKLVARFYDADEGSVRVDGHDVRGARAARFSYAARLRSAGGVPVHRDPFATTSRTGVPKRRMPRSKPPPVRLARTSSSSSSMADICTSSPSAADRCLPAIANSSRSLGRNW